jgi:hypothetical protein
MSFPLLTSGIRMGGILPSMLDNVLIGKRQRKYILPSRLYSDKSLCTVVHKLGPERGT